MPPACWKVPLILRIWLCFLRDSTLFTASFIELFDFNVAQTPYGIRHDKNSRSPLLLHRQTPEAMISCVLLLRKLLSTKEALE